MSALEWNGILRLPQAALAGGRRIPKTVLVRQALLTKEIEKTQYYLACPSRPIPTNLPESARVVTQSAFFDAISNYAKPVSAPAPKPVSASETPASFEPPSESN